MYRPTCRPSPVIEAGACVMPGEGEFLPSFRDRGVSIFLRSVAHALIGYSPFFLLVVLFVFQAAGLSPAWPIYGRGFWYDDLADDAGLAVLYEVARDPGDIHLRGRVQLLGQVTVKGESFDTCALACAENGIIYGGTMGFPPSGKAVLFRYDPDLPWTNDDHYQPNSNPRILGDPFPHVSWVSGSDLWIWDVLVYEGKIYGGVYNWKEESTYHDQCRRLGGRMFVYDPARPWDPGTGVHNNPRDLGQAVAGEAGILGLCVGNDGFIYGGTISSSIKYKEPPPPGKGGHVFRLDPSTVYESTPSFQDLGELDSENIEMVWSLAPHPNPAVHKIYAGTANGAWVYELDTVTLQRRSLGRLEEAEYGYASEMLAGIDGRIYVGTYPSCRLGVYDPAHPERGLVNRGSVLDNQRELPGLTNGKDGYIYLATYGHYRPGAYSDGCLLRLNPATEEIENLGPAVGELSGYPFAPLYWVDGLCTSADGRIFGAGYGTYMFLYDPRHVYEDNGETTSVAVYPGIGVWGQVIPRPNTVNARQRITGIAPASDGSLYGGTFVEWWGHPEHSLERGGRLFRYRPGDAPGTGELKDLGQALPTEYGVWGPREGPDGNIYFGTEPHGHLARYVVADGEFQDLGIPYPGGQRVRALTFLGDTLIGGTYPGAYLFLYRLSGGDPVLLGQPMTGKTEIEALLTASEGLVYGTCGPGLYFFVYDPSLPWNPGDQQGNNPRLFDVPGYDSHSYGLAEGADGKIYVATYPEGRIYTYDPQAQQFAAQPEYPGDGRGILSLVRGSDGKIYGGTEYEDIASEDHELIIRFEDGSYHVIPWACGWEDAVTALACGKNGRLYGGTGPFGYFFEYEPGYWFTWNRASFDAVIPSGTSLRVDVLDREGNLLREDISPDEDISAISPQDHPALRLRARLETTHEELTPRLRGWSLRWSPGGPPPVLESLVEEDGDGDVHWGETVELRGSNFGGQKGSSRVEFAGTPAEDYLAWSDDFIRLRVPPGCAAGQVRVYTMNGESNGLSYALEPRISGIVPSSGIWGERVHMELSGACFQSGAGVMLRRSGHADIPAENVVVASSTRITCDFDLAGGWPGRWDVSVRNPDGKEHVLVEGFTINPVVTASVSGGGGSVHPLSQEVPYGGTAVIDLRPEPGYRAASVTDNGVPVPLSDPYVIEKVAGNHQVVVAFEPEPAPERYRYFFPEGYTGEGFEEYLTLANPNPETAHLQVEFLTNAGHLRTIPVEIPGRTRRTLNVNQLAGEGLEVSISITSDLPVAAERPMYFNYRGKWTGGHVETGMNL